MTTRIELLTRIDVLLRDADQLAEQHRDTSPWRWLLRRRLARQRNAALTEVRDLMREHDRRWPA